MYIYTFSFYTIVGLHHYNLRHSDANLQPRLYTTTIMLLPTWLPLLGSRDGIGHVTIRHPMWGLI